MSLLKLNLKLFFKNKTRLIFLMLFIVGIIIYGYRNEFRWIEDINVSLSVVQSQIRICVYYFIALLYLTFDYFFENKKANLVEVIKTSGKGQMRIELNQMIIPLLINIVFSAQFFLQLFFVNIYTCGYDGAVIWKFIEIAFVFIFLNGIVAVLAGFLLSKIKYKLLGYVGLLGICFAISPMMTTQLEAMAMVYGEVVGKTSKLFLIMPQGLDYLSGHYILPTNKVIMARSLVWIGVCLGILFCCYRKKLMYIFAGISFGFAILMVYTVYSPYSFFCTDNTCSYTDSGQYEQWYYILNQNKDIGKDEKENYHITKYDIDIEAKDYLKAKVKLTIDEDSLDTYKMTLYHRYLVDSVTNQDGETLEYTQDGDYIEIYNKNHLSIKNIVMTYGGVNSTFYTNSTEMYLPGWFPYYPKPGYEKIYNFENYGYYATSLDYEAEFNIKIDSKSTVYSDLPKLDDNQFTGKANGVTLISGFVKDIDIGGVRYIYAYTDNTCNPTMSYMKDCINEITNTVKDEDKNLEITWKLKNKTIIIEPMVNDMVGMTCFTNGATIYDAHNILKDYERYNKYGDANAKSEEEIVEWIKMIYQTYSYTELKNEYNKLLAVGNREELTDEEFDKIIIDNLGEDVLNTLKERD